MDPAGSGECGHSTDVGTEAGAHSHSPPKRDKLVKGSGLLTACVCCASMCVCALVWGNPAITGQVVCVSVRVFELVVCVCVPGVATTPGPGVATTPGRVCPP